MTAIELTSVHLSVATIGTFNVPRGSWLYTITADDIVLYVGQTTDPMKRLRVHFCPPGCIAWGGSAVTTLARASWESAQRWRIDLAKVTGDLDAAEASRIRKLRPCLNVQHNPKPRRVPKHLREARLQAQHEVMVSIHEKFHKRRNTL